MMRNEALIAVAALALMSSSSSSDTTHLTCLALLALWKQRRKNYNCEKCNPPRPRMNNGNSSSSESDVTIYECDCTTESSGSTEDSGSMEDSEPTEKPTSTPKNSMPVQDGKKKLVSGSGSNKPSIKTSIRFQPPTGHSGVANVQGSTRPSTFVSKLQPPSGHTGVVNVQGPTRPSTFVRRLQPPSGHTGVVNVQGPTKPSTFVPRLQPPSGHTGVNVQGPTKPSTFVPRLQPHSGHTGVVNVQGPTRPSTFVQRLQPPSGHTGVVNVQGLTRPSSYLSRFQPSTLHRGLINDQGSMRPSFDPRLRPTLYRGVVNPQSSMRPTTFMPRSNVLPNVSQPPLPRGVVNSQGLMRHSNIFPRYQSLILQRDEAFIRDMKAIEYWVMTQRPPCTYGLKTVLYTKVQNSVNPSEPASKVLPVRVPSAAEDKHLADKTMPKKNLSFLEDDSVSGKSEKRVFFKNSFGSLEQSQDKILLTNTGNGDGYEKNCAKSKEPKSNHGISTKQKPSPNSKELMNNKSLESQIKMPILDVSAVEYESQNIFETSSKENVANSSSPKCKVTTSKNKFSSNVESPQKNKNHTYQLRNTRKEPLEQSSDSSVLTAPYIRSTQNDASKSNCRKLSRQRAIRDKSKNLHVNTSDMVDPLNKPHDTAFDTLKKVKHSKSMNGDINFVPDSSCEIQPKTDTDTQEMHKHRVVRKANSMQIGAFLRSSVHLKRKSEIVEQEINPLTKRSKRLSGNISTQIESALNKDETCVSSSQAGKSRLSNLLSDGEEDSYVEEKKYFR